MLRSDTIKKYNTYKDSGIEWIGEIPQDWRILPHKHILSKVKNICEKYAGEDIISLTMKGVIKRDLDNPMGKMPLTFDGYQRIEAGNLLLCLFDIDVTPRCVGLIKNNGLTSPAYSQFEFLGLDCPQYYTYLLTMIDDDKCFLHLAKNLRSSLTEDNFGAILTIQPTVKEQQAIADYLDKKCGEIDRVVEAEKSVIEKLKEYKQSIITEAVTKGLDKSVPLKDSGIEWIGKIPQHWEMQRLKQLISRPLQYGANESGDPFNENLPRYIRITDIKIEDNSLKEEGKLSLSIDKAQDYILSDGDILFARSGATVGKTFLYKSEYGLSAFAGYLIRATIKEFLNPKYIYYFTLSCSYEEWKNRIFIQATIQNIGANKYNNLEISLPIKEEQEQIVAYLDQKCSEIDKAIADKEQLIEKITEYKKSLVYECVTGKRKVVT